MELATGVLVHRPFVTPWAAAPSMERGTQCTGLLLPFCAGDEALGMSCWREAEYTEIVAPHGEWNQMLSRAV